MKSFKELQEILSLIEAKTIDIDKIKNKDLNKKAWNLLKKGGKRCAEVPVLMCPRTGGKSSITPVHSVYYMVKVLLALMVDLVRVAWSDEKEKR